MGVGGLQISENDIVSSFTDIHSSPQTDTSMLLGREIVHTVNSLEANGPYVFCLNAPSEYILLASGRMFLEFSVVRGDGHNIDATDDCSIVNSIGASLFESIRFEWNNQPCTVLDTDNLPYKAYLETLLSYGVDATNSHLRAGLWLTDTPGSFNAVEHTPFSNAAVADGAPNLADHPNAVYCNNKAYVARGRWIRNSRLCQVMLPIPADIMQSDSLLPPDLKVKISFHRASPRNYMLATAAHGTARSYKIKISQFKLYFTHITLSDALAKLHTKQSLTRSPTLHFKQTHIKSMLIHGETNKAVLADVFEGVMPTSVQVVLVDTQAISGEYHLNPFLFHHYNMSMISLRMNNNVIPIEPYETDFAGGRFIRIYRKLHDSTGIGIGNCGSMVDMNLFAGGATIAAFDLTPDCCNGYHKHVPIVSTLSVEIKFAVRTPHSITALVFGTFDASFKIPSGTQHPIMYLS